MGLLTFVIDLLASSANSSMQNRYDVARRASRNTSLSEEKRNEAKKIAENTKKEMEEFKTRQIAAKKISGKLQKIKRSEQ